MGVEDFVGGGKSSNPPEAIFTLGEYGRPADSFRPRAVDKPPKMGEFSAKGHVFRTKVVDF